MQTTRHLQQRFNEYFRNKWPIISDFTNCGINLIEGDISILRKLKRREYRLLTLEALFIKELAPVIKTKNE